MRRTGLLFLGICAAGCADTAVTPWPVAHRITGYAVLPAETFVPGPTSGQFIEASNGVGVPFVDRQPIQGFSDVHPHSPGRYYVISDNGYGSRDNSADFLIRATLIEPEFRTTEGGAAVIRVVRSVLLSDPDSVIGIPLVA